MKNKKLAIFILLLFAIQIFIDFFYDNKILSKSLLYVALILTSLNLTKLSSKKDYAIFITGFFCYTASILTRVFYPEYVYFFIPLSLLAMIIHFGLYYKNKED